MKLLVVIVNFRTPDLTWRAARSVLQDAGDLDLQVEIVDNQSDDGSFQQLLAQVTRAGCEDRVTVTASGRNGGFGFGNNVAIARALRGDSPPDAFFLLNPDAVVLPGCTRALVERLRDDSRVGVAGTRIRYPDGSASSSAFRFPSVLSEIESGLRLGLLTPWLGRYRVALPLPTHTCEVDWVSGTSMMIRRTALERAGLFDEDFFLYFEEIDLCRRIRAAGFTVTHVCEAQIEHLEGASTGVGQGRPVPRYWFESRRRYFQKNHGRVYFVAASLAWAAGATIDRGRRAVQRRPADRPAGMVRAMLRETARVWIR